MWQKRMYDSGEGLVYEMGGGGGMGDFDHKTYVKAGEFVGRIIIIYRYQRILHVLSVCVWSE